MVLDADDGQGFVLHAFDRAVLGVDHGHLKGLGELLDGLMVVMESVHRGSVELAHVSAFFCLCIAVLIVIVAFADVLFQRSTEGDVDELAAAADAKDRLLRLDELLHQSDLEPVEGLHVFMFFAFDFGMIEGWMHVLAAGDDQAVVLGRVDILGCAGLHDFDDVGIVRCIVALNEFADVLVFGFWNQNLQRRLLHGALSLSGGDLHGTVGSEFILASGFLVGSDDIGVFQAGLKPLIRKGCA